MISYLIGVKDKWTVVTKITPTIPIGVDLIGISHVWTVIPFVPETCVINNNNSNNNNNEFV